MAKTERDNDIVPVYLPLVTLRSSVQTLREHGLPPKIDKSAFSSRSGADQGQIMSAFKFLGLIDKDDQTQPILKRLHDAKQNSDEEKKVFNEMLKLSYSTVFNTIDLKTATSAQLADAIGSYGTSGTTRNRAVRFFIKAAEYSGIPLSGHLTHGTRMRENPPATPNNGSGTTPKAKRKKRLPAANAEQFVQKTESAMKTISLPIAKGTLTLSGSFNPFELVGDERDLVYQIIDQLNEYEKKSVGEKKEE